MTNRSSETMVAMERGEIAAERRAAGRHELERIGPPRLDQVRGRELEVALDRRRQRGLVAKPVVRHAVEQARGAGHEEAREGDHAEQEQQDATFLADAMQQDRGGGDEPHPLLLAGPQHRGEADPRQQPGQ